MSYYWRLLYFKIAQLIGCEPMIDSAYYILPCKKCEQPTVCPFENKKSEFLYCTHCMYSLERSLVTDAEIGILWYEY